MLLYAAIDVPLERQGRDFWDVVEESLFSPDSYHYEQNALDSDIANEKFDVAGFSFGGQVSMADALHI